MEHRSEAVLQDKVCLVSGAGNGIGRAVAVEFARAGGRVCLCDIDQAAVEETYSQLISEGLGDAVWVAVVNVADQPAVSALISEIARKHQRLDVLAHCAAIQEEAGFFDVTAEQWRRILDVNLFGTFCLGQAAALLMRDRATADAACNGKIINLTSIHDSLPRQGKYAYDASKAGISALTREMALTLAEWRINVNAIAPGVVDTPMNQVLRDDPQALAAALRRVPWQRAGEAGEIARLALFLASADADYITGAIIPIDGGRSLFSGVVAAGVPEAQPAVPPKPLTVWQRLLQKFRRTDR